ncbi:MAG: GNAT family N-acetyltransferase [Anaerolineae bacterium]|nr:GNAT family N-acetyltransferase [Anaerolineae bacterium]NUQ07408.1 GNAT family N-acetyltransferase [Anaerolineae bacterium]
MSIFPADLDLIRGVEERATNALPAQDTLLYDGWVIRAADHAPRRANAVHVFHRSTLPLNQKIDFCQAFYWARGARSIFKITPLCEDGLIPALEARGYTDDPSGLVQATEALDVPDLPPHDAEIELLPRPTQDWTADNGRLHEFSAAQTAAHAALSARLPTPAAFVRLRRDGRTLALALGVMERGWIGIYSVITDPAERDRGYASAALAALFDWGRGAGAARAYLQVMRTNAAAQRVYARFGFTTLYPYGYRFRLPG